MAAKLHIFHVVCIWIMLFSMMEPYGSCRKPKQSKKHLGTPCRKKDLQNGNCRLTKLRAMTFNVWVGGVNVENGVNKIAQHIRLSQADIVFTQESSDQVADAIINLLGPQQWRRCTAAVGNVAVITRHHIIEEYQPSNRLGNAGCKIRVSEQPPAVINAWSVHQDWRDYGSYTACITNRTSPVLQDLLKANEYKYMGDDKGRMNNVLSLLRHDPFASNVNDVATTPMILAGDFNTPSHLDWTPAAKKLHCNVSFMWPVTKALADAGFRDTYRIVYRDPVRNAGNTWSSIYTFYTEDPTRKTPEPQDRIDFIFFKGKKLKPVASKVYKGQKEVNPYPYHFKNDWPSDHAAVITDFELRV